jgi:hypothetical protein
VFDAGVVTVVVGEFGASVLPDVPVLAGVCVAVTVGIDVVDVFVRVAVGVGVELTVQVIINCGDWVVLFSRV